jgi:hypothetical protein
MKRLCICCNRPRRYQDRPFCYECWTAGCPVEIPDITPVLETASTSAPGWVRNWKSKLRIWR